MKYTIPLSDDKDTPIKATIVPTKTPISIINISSNDIDNNPLFLLKVILVSIDVNNIAPNASLNADSLITVCFNLFLIGIF